MYQTRGKVRRCTTGTTSVKVLATMHGISKRRSTYIATNTPDGINAKRLDSTDGCVDRVELDAEYEKHLVVDGVGMGDVADISESLGGELNDVGNSGEVIG